MDRSSSTTVAKFIQRFRQSEPLPREERRRRRQEAKEGDFWWTRSQENFGEATEAVRSRCNDIEDRSSTHVAENAKPLPFLESGEGKSPQPSIGSPPKQSESDDCENERPTLDQIAVLEGSQPPLNSPPGRRAHDELPTQLSKRGSEAPELVNDRLATAEAEAADTNVHETGVHDMVPVGLHAENLVLNKSINARDGGGDELQTLDARARTLLQECRQVLAPSSTITLDEVASFTYSASQSNGPIIAALDDLPEELEKRAWMLLNHCEEPPLLPAYNEEVLAVPCSSKPPAIDAQGDLVRLGKYDGKTAKVLLRRNPPGGAVARPLGEREGAYHLDQGRGCQSRCSSDVRNLRDVNIDSIGRVCSTIAESRHSNRERTWYSPALDSSGVQERMSSMTVATTPGEEDWFRQDPVLSALLRRHDEVEAELKRRRALEPNGNLVS
ncbi:unnamed protein product [Ectocarpus sp. CCAP 1310/34]|nr:unnamed protein product [Ectocarpus sp. CCAP 1310/34]